MFSRVKLLHSFYVFIKEVILGKATLRQAYEYDPRRVYVLFIIIVSLLLNSVTIPLSIKSLKRIVELKEEVRVLETALAEKTNSLSQTLPENIIKNEN